VGSRRLPAGLGEGMRIRTIKPEFWQSETMASIHKDSRLLAIALLNYADDEGFFFAVPQVIQGALFPFDKAFVPHPSTWFNQQRWTDDRATWARTASTAPQPPTEDEWMEAAKRLDDSRDRQRDAKWSSDAARAGLHRAPRVRNVAVDVVHGCPSAIFSGPSPAPRARP